MLLITPHGDREPSRRSRRRCRRAAHYPSWGSGTGNLSQASTTPSASSLPLMGIGNRELEPGFDDAFSELITPHGDREPGAGGMRIVHPNRSLPLMGIGNSPPPGPYSAAQTRPHYPSWGSGTISWIPRTLLAVHSLPLMGIGNLELSLLGQREGVSLPLMGIGNPGGAGADRRAVARAHYPSWGSGTRCVA